MKWILSLLAILLITVLDWLPFQGTDVATLEPAESIYVSIENEKVCVETDGGWLGSGKSVEEAVADLNKSAPGKVFLETVDYLLLKKGCENLIPALYSYLRSGCSVCLVEEKPDLQNVSEYLRAHRLSLTLQDYRAGNTKIPELRMEEDRGYLDE